jgi:hypothetical protein
MTQSREQGHKRFLKTIKKGNKMYVVIVLMVMIWAACSVLCRDVALRKNRGEEWVIYGLLFGVFALIAIYALPVIPPPEKFSAHVDADNEGEHGYERCRFCGFTHKKG